MDINNSIFSSYSSFLSSRQQLPCQSAFDKVPEIHRFNMLDRVLYERIDRKASEFLTLLEENNNYWEETIYQYIAQLFGFKTQPFRPKFNVSELLFTIKYLINVETQINV
mgnify:CR=1 FL=1